MDHQTFRFYIPGIIFLMPIYLVACWIAINNVTIPDIRTFILIGGITTFPAISLPIGWWIYNVYRILWLKITRGGYENKDFVRLIKKDTKPFYSPLTHSILIDFSHIKEIESWIKIDLNLFRKSFYPFTSPAKFKSEIEKNSIVPKFTEPLSDFILWKDNGYDYARSISTVRYGIESSVFALFFGGLYAFGLKVIWLYHIEQSNSLFVYLLWIILLIILSSFFIILLFIRWRYADKEYDARLILTTLTSMKSNYFDVKFLTDNIHPEIVERIDGIVLSGRPYAAFDLDNTLLIDDIGDAVFATLLSKGLISGFGWNDYLNLLKENRELAYKKVIEVMDGLKLIDLEKITNEIIQSDEKFIEIDNYKIPIPRPNTIMQSLISYLKTKGIDVFVVTASNNVSAEIICWKFFGIPSSNVIGATVAVDNKNRISFKTGEIPFGPGKVNVLKKKFTHKPIVTGGDGMWDRFLLEYTATEGLRLWLGQNIDEYNQLKNELFKEVNFYTIPRV
jgi:phosphoserine phosphatase